MKPLTDGYRYINKTFSLLGITLGTALTGCQLKTADVSGQYVIEGELGHVAVILNTDGTFFGYGDKQSSGKWRLNDHQFFDQGLELDGQDNKGGFADEYLFVRRHGSICIQVSEDSVYWCKQ